MFRSLAVLVLIGALVPSGARADLERFVEICGGAKSTAREIVNFCQKAIETGRLNREARAQVYANLSIGYYELQQYMGAVNAATRALENDPGLVAALLNRAKAHEKLLKLEEAIDDYERALALDPNAADAYLGRGILLLRHGRAYASIPDLSKALLIDRELGVARFNRGLAFLEIGQPSRAQEDFSELIRQNPEDAEAFLYRGQARAALNRPEAAGDFDKAVQLAGEWGMAWFVRGRYRDSTGDREGANSDFLRAYELGHDDPWLIERVREIGG